MADTDTRTIDDVLDGLRFAMVTTQSRHGLTARPITLLGNDGGRLHFLVSKSADWVQELGGTEPVQASFADPKKNTYVALTGHAHLDDDPALIRDLWNPAAEIYFEGPDDPDAVALEVEVTSGEWWDGPSGRIGQAISLVAAAITRDASKEGQSGTVAPG